MRFSRRGQRRLRLQLRGRPLPLGVLAAVFVAVLIWTMHELRQPGPWQRVFATREGLTGSRLATGGIIRAGDQFVALPHPSALRRDVELRYQGRALVVPVLDVGPWNVDDDYWSNGQRPASERGRGAYRTPANRAGIDLSDATFATLGLRDNDTIEWRFVHRGYIPFPRLATVPPKARATATATMTAAGATRP